MSSHHCVVAVLWTVWAQGFWGRERASLSSPVGQGSNPGTASPWLTQVVSRSKHIASKLSKGSHRVLCSLFLCHQKGQLSLVTVSGVA